MKDAINLYVKRVGEVLAEHVKGNEQATKKSLIEPLLTALGYDLTDPRECVPEHREDFGRSRSAKPVDYALFKNGKAIIFIEAKDVSRSLAGFDEQLADYFAKAPGTKLGILTNGVHWRFFTDVEHDNMMDKSPFLEWQVLTDPAPPWEFLSLLQKTEISVENLRTYAERKHSQNLLVTELNRLLEPAPEFIRLALSRIETRRNVTTAIVEAWKPVLRSALAEWAKQQRLSSALASEESHASQPAAAAAPSVETTPAELAAFNALLGILGPGRPAEYEDSASYFKLHLPGRPPRGFCRLYNFGHESRAPQLSVPLTAQVVTELCGVTKVSTIREWSTIRLASVDDLPKFAELVRRAYDQVSAECAERSTDLTSSR